MEMGLVEPLRELFKDEVRKIGLELGLPYNMLYRHPFPGPGLGVRVLGEIKKEYCDLLRRADAIFIEELHAADLYHKVSQAFTVFLPVRSVGVMGDGRKYDWVVSLRAVETIDFMTAHWHIYRMTSLVRFRTVLSTKLMVSLAWFTTSQVSRQRPSSGNNPSLECKDPQLSAGFFICA